MELQRTLAKPLLLTRSYLLEECREPRTMRYLELPAQPVSIDLHARDGDRENVGDFLR